MTMDVSKLGVAAVFRSPDIPQVSKLGVTVVMRPQLKVEVTKIDVVAVLRPIPGRRRMSLM